MNKIAAKTGAVLLAAGLILSVSGCSGQKDTSVTAIQEAGVFKVAIVDTGSQYTSLDGEKPVGTEPELIESIASALGAAAEYQVLSREEALAAVSAGGADVAIGCISQSGSLEENHLLSTSYGKGFAYVVTKKGDFAQTTGAFSGSSIGVEQNLEETTRSQISSVSGVSVTPYEDPEEAAAAIKAGMIRAYICYESEAKELLSDSDLQVQNLSGTEAESYVIAAEKTDLALISGINVMIQQFLTKE